MFTDTSLGEPHVRSLSRSPVMRTATVLMILSLQMSGCASTSHTDNARYVPSFYRPASGFRPRLPPSPPEVTYIRSEWLPPEIISAIQRDFAEPIIADPYSAFIGAITITCQASRTFDLGAPYADTTFTIWLLDGRKLEAGTILPHAAQIPDIGKRFSRRARELLHAAIPEQRLRQ